MMLCHYQDKILLCFLLDDIRSNTFVLLLQNSSVRCKNKLCKVIDELFIEK